MRKHKKVICFVVVTVIALLIMRHYRESGAEKLPQLLPYPDGKLYSFTIVDDVDFGKLESIKPVYSLFDELGLRITKTIWMFSSTNCDDENSQAKYTLELPEYEDFALSLQEKGYEIALHGASGCDDFRETTLSALEKFKDIFGHYPYMNVDHSKNRENLYFGKNRVNSKIYRFLYSFYDKKDYYGEDENSKYFWGDASLEKIKYQRDWYFHELNALAINPSIPYHDPEKKYVQYWHSVTDAEDMRHFNIRVTNENVKKLKSENGAAFVYTHLGSGFYDLKSGKLNQDFEKMMRGLAADEDLWIHPASYILDRFLLFKNVELKQAGNALFLYNLNDTEVKSVTFLDSKEHEGNDYVCRSGCNVLKKSNGTFVIDVLPSGSVTVLDIAGKPGSGYEENKNIHFKEKMNCLAYFLKRAVLGRLE